jgi:hypothetical protein
MKEFTVKQCAEEAEISYSCAFNIINKILAGKSDEEILNVKKGRRRLENYELQSTIRNILNVDAALTLESLKEKLSEASVIASTSTISRSIKAINFTRKRLSLVPEERNSQGTWKTVRHIVEQLSYCMMMI